MEPGSGQSDRRGFQIESIQRWPSNSSQVIGPLALAAKGFAAREQLGKLGLEELARA
jgi:hypothetical protein